MLCACMNKRTNKRCTPLCVNKQKTNIHVCSAAAPQTRHCVALKIMKNKQTRRTNEWTDAPSPWRLNEWKKQTDATDKRINRRAVVAAHEIMKNKQTRRTNEWTDAPLPWRLNEWKKQTDAADKRTNRRAVAAMACEQTNELSLPPLSVSQNEQTNNTFFQIILWIQHSYMDSRLSSQLREPGFNSSRQQTFFN